MLYKRKISIWSPLALMVLIMIAGNSSAQKASRSELNSSFDIRYGTVELSERVKVSLTTPDE